MLLKSTSGSAFADYVFEQIGRTSAGHSRSKLSPADPSIATYLPRIYEALGRLRIQTGAFRQLTRRYMNEDFNPNTPDREGVR